MIQKYSNYIQRDLPAICRPMMANVFVSVNFCLFFLLISLSLSLNHLNDSRLNPMTLRITLIMKEEKNNQNSSPHLFFSPPFEIAKKNLKIQDLDGLYYRNIV